MSLRLKQQGTREQFSYNEVVLKGASKKLSLLGQTCAVCLEEFRTRDELGVCPCSHAFHKKCLLKWLEIRSVCPMCNKPILRLHTDAPQGAEGPMDPEEVWGSWERGNRTPLTENTHIKHTKDDGQRSSLRHLTGNVDNDPKWPPCCWHLSSMPWWELETDSTKMIWSDQSGSGWMNRIFS